MGAAVVEDKIFQALADPSRRAILESLTRGETAVKDLTARFDISQPAVSQHLATLKDAGLVNGRREGRCVYYRVEPRGMKPLIDWIAHYRAFWTEHVSCPSSISSSSPGRRSRSRRSRTPGGTAS